MLYFLLGKVPIKYKCAKSYPYRFISLPRRIGRIISTELGDSAISSSFFALSIIKASLQPVFIP